MTLWTPANSFQSIISNVADGTVPAINPGTVITASGSTNTKGSWTELIGGASVTSDVYAIELWITDYGFGGQNSAALMDIGYDPTNSASYTVKINNLNVSNAGTFFTSPGGGDCGPIHYFFPLFFPSGTQFAARVQSNVGSRAGSVWIKLFTKPTHPHLVRSGAYVTTFGGVTATSLGVSVTPGTAAEGAWADISGADTTLPYWYWTFGAGVNDTTMTDRVLYADLGIGDGSNKHVVINDAQIATGSSESVAKWPHGGQGFYDVAAGVRAYGRMQSSGALDSGYHMTAYGVGG